MVVTMIMNCDSCCLTVLLTKLLTGAQVENIEKKTTKEKKKKNLNKSSGAA